MNKGRGQDDTCTKLFPECQHMRRDAQGVKSGGDDGHKYSNGAGREDDDHSSEMKMSAVRHLGRGVLAALGHGYGYGYDQ